MTTSTIDRQQAQEELMELRQQMVELRKDIAKKTQDLPAEPVDNWEFTDWMGATITLLDLFGDRGELILVHNMGASCSYCTMWADDFNGMLHYIEDRAAFVVTSPDSPETQQAFATKRGWKFRMASATDAFVEAMDMAHAEAGYMPGVSTFVRDGDSIVRKSNDHFGPDDPYCGTWALFDLLPGGYAAWDGGPRFLDPR